ncbi:malate synthase A [Saccharothrix sp. 6-C]|uniref:malate synthase A n=1 Tax=Saccharothrix sp. 6-C TaxID=2781735 RepID=UPI001916DE99|nr:malate synthase A [Saccharothrix sp. 6-C]QQQ75215.1 malate synthase A [Saccharothrix sp. 6-C]
MSGVRVLGGEVERGDEILTPDALEFVAELHRAFALEHAALMRRRADRRPLGFLPETQAIRDGDWRVAEAPEPLRDRRVEITGPTERKMTVNALNSGAKVWLADLEDANTPHWHNVVSGQVNLYDAARGTVEHTSPEGKHYTLRDDVPRPTIVVRPRGWHLPERHVEVDGRPAIGALVDFGLHFFHNAGLGRPYYYLPKMESHLEARLWNDVFTAAQRRLGVPHGTIRATVLIETIPAAFEMDEILYELREHASGLNAGRWDYLFSIIKYFRDAGRDFVLPDRNSITMTVPFMRAYTELLVHTCHKRGAFAMGGMAAFIPNRRDPEVTRDALAKVRDDKRREAGDGFDGSWVAHPDLVGECAEIFDQKFSGSPNQLDELRPEVSVTAEQLLDFASAGGSATRAGVASAVDVGVRYLMSWLGGNGAAAIHNLMEDAATAEISRSQLWQWVHNDVVLDDGTPVTADLVRDALAWAKEELEGEHLDLAVELFEQVALSDEFVDFLTLPAYERIG